MSIIIYYPSGSGGGGGTEILTAANFSALPAAADHTGEFYWCEAAQGTSWLPGTLGGTYYPKGLYYSNGTSWNATDLPYNATIAEVNTGTNNDKFVTPSTFTNASKWGNYVPYTGATTDVDLGTNAFNAESVKLTGTAGLGHLHLRHQSSDATASANNTALFADASGDIKYKNDGNYYTTLKTSLNTADRVYTFPNASGTVALTSDIPNTSLIPNLTGHESFRGVQYANNSTTETTFGGITIASTASTLARTADGTNFASKQIRKAFYASVVSSGRYTGTRGSALLFFLGGGFRYICDFYIADTAYAAGCRQFYGLAGQTTDLGYSDTTQVDSLVNIIGVGSDAADANLQIFHNDASGTATKIDLGVDFPANRTAGAAMTTMYSVTLYNADNSSNIIYRVSNNETGVAVEGTISTNLPLSTQGLNFYASRCMGGGGGLTNSGRFDLSVLGVFSN